MSQVFSDWVSALPGDRTQAEAMRAWDPAGGPPGRYSLIQKSYFVINLLVIRYKQIKYTIIVYK